MWVFSLARGTWKEACTFATAGKSFVERRERDDPSVDRHEHTGCMWLCPYLWSCGSKPKNQTNNFDNRQKRQNSPGPLIALLVPETSPSAFVVICGSLSLFPLDFVFCAFKSTLTDMHTSSNPSICPFRAAGKTRLELISFASQSPRAALAPSPLTWNLLSVFPAYTFALIKSPHNS